MSQLTRPDLCCATAGILGKSPSQSGGRYWVRTSDLFGVNEARYHCANRPGSVGRKTIAQEPSGASQDYKPVEPRGAPNGGQRTGFGASSTTQAGFGPVIRG